MSDAAALLRAINAAPKEDTPRLVLADLYEYDRPQLACDQWVVGEAFVLEGVGHDQRRFGCHDVSAERNITRSFGGVEPIA